MTETLPQQWPRRALLVGVVYLVASIATAQLAATAASNRIQFFWRLSAFIVSAVVFAAHIAYEYFRVGNTARPTALHTSLAVAFGAFLLALVANIHDLGSASGYRPRMLIALVAWPLLTAVPAFIVALLLAAGLSLTRFRT
jgi:hypothetical protein